MVSAIIIDDEKKCISLLQHLIYNHCPLVNVVGTAENAEQGLLLIKQAKPDLVFLDIEMPDKTGFELLASLAEINFKVIFTTAYNHYAIKAIRFSALDYLLKPIDLDELKNALGRLEGRKNLKDAPLPIDILVNNIKTPGHGFSRITLSTQDGLVVLHVNEILYCEASGSYTFFYLKNGEKLTISKTLKEYDELLGEFQFFRIHNSYLVNLNEVKKYIKGEGGSVIMSNGDEVFVSKRRKDAFLEAINK